MTKILDYFDRLHGLYNGQMPVDYLFGFKDGAFTIAVLIVVANILWILGKNLVYWFKRQNFWHR